MPSMAIPKVGRRRQLAVLSLHLAVVVALNMVTAQAPPPPQRQLLTTITRLTVPTTLIIIAFFVLVLFCVLVNQWRRSSGRRLHQGSIQRRRRGLNPSALAALPVVPYVDISKHMSGGGGGGGGVLECAVCLAAFGDGDKLRLLPQCSHAFHPDCIDPWLEGHVTCPLCRTNLEQPPVPETKSPQTPEAVSVRVEPEDEEERKVEEAAELEKLRCVRRVARMMLRSRSTGHSVSTRTETGDHERFTVRLPAHVREEVLRSRRLRHATSLVVSLGGASSACSVGGERCHGARRRWASFLSRTSSWAQRGGEGSSARRKDEGQEGGTGTTRRPPPCGHVVCKTAARWPARCKGKNLAS